MPDGTGFAYDDKLFPTSLPLFDNANLLFTLIGSNGSLVFENLYSAGSSAQTQKPQQAHTQSENKNKSFFLNTYVTARY